MKLIIPWPSECVAALQAAKDAPPGPIGPHLERLRDSNVPSDAKVLERGARVGHYSCQYWYVTYLDANVIYLDANHVTVRAVLLFVDVMFEVTVVGDPIGILAALDDSALDFGDEVASLYQLFQEVT